MLFVDTILRSVAVGQLLLVILVISRATASRMARVATCGFLLCVSAYLIAASPDFVSQAGGFRLPVELASQTVPLALWAFAHLIFEQRLDRRVAGAAFLIVLGFWLASAPQIGAGDPSPTTVVFAQDVLALLLVSHTIMIALSTRRDDLVERRRWFRVGLVTAIGVEVVAAVIGEVWYGGPALSPTSIIQAGTCLLSVSAFGSVAMVTDAALLFPAARPEAEPAMQFSPAETVLKAALDAAMRQEAWKTPGLSIGDLAASLGAPEHQLRALINQRLGFRNFSAYLNDHRIREAKVRLTDPVHVRLPVLTIAMDLGYGSLAPFNRAFRADTGQTPSEYRKAALATFEQS